MLKSAIKKTAKDKFRQLRLEKSMRTLRIAWTYLVIAFVALVASVNYELFVFPNQFAPSGINGICTMIQYVTHISVGYLSLLVNIPLAIWCYVEVTLIFTITNDLFF